MNQKNVASLRITHVMASLTVSMARMNRTVQVGIMQLDFSCFVPQVSINYITYEYLGVYGTTSLIPRLY